MMSSGYLSSANLIYVANYIDILHGVVVFPLEGEPTVFALAYAAQAAAQSVIEDVRWGAAINHDAIVDRLREGGFERATIGICDSLPHDMWLYLREALPEARLIEARDLMFEVRLCPSERGARVVPEGGEVLRPRVRGRRRRGPPRDEGVRARRGDSRHLPPARRIALRGRARREPDAETRRLLTPGGSPGGRPESSSPGT